MGNVRIYRPASVYTREEVIGMSESTPGRGSRIRAEDVTAVKDRLRIDEVVRAAGVELRSAGGGSLKGLCPFHDEKTASFHVQPSRGKYHCFGCGEGGDVFDFVVAVDHLSFAEAVLSLADQAGIQVRMEGAGSQDHSKWAAERDRRLAIKNANSAAAEFFVAALRSPDALPARRYLSDKAFSAADVEPFAVGYAPRDNSLSKALRARFPEQTLLDANLVSRRRSGELRDRFAGRVMFPIRDVTGKVIGFGARRLFDDDPIEAKYLNTSETLLYSKSHVLYGLDLGKRQIVETRRVNVVEGYTDVIACHLAGASNTTATCGTSFADGHVQILRRLLVDEQQSPGKVVFAYDSDAAGLKAAVKAFESQEQFAGALYVAAGADGRDPCDLRAQDGDEVLRSLLDRPRPLVELVLKAAVGRHDVASAEGRAAAVAAAVPVLSKISNPALQQDYVRQTAGWVGLPSPDLLIQAVRSGRGRPEIGDGGGPQIGHLAQVEWEAVKLASHHPQAFGRQLAGTGSGVFADPVHRRLVALVEQYNGWESAVEHARDSGDVQVRKVAARAEVEPMLAALDDQAAVEEFARAVFEQLTGPGRQGRLTRLRAALAGLDPDDVEGAAAMMQAIDDIERGSV